MRKDKHYAYPFLYIMHTHTLFYLEAGKESEFYKKYKILDNCYYSNIEKVSG